jgi:hypothetical protein
MRRSSLALSMCIALSASACHKPEDSKPTSTAPTITPPDSPTVALESRSRQGSLVVSTRVRNESAELALIADEDDRALLLVNVTTGEAQARIGVDSRPAQILVLENGLVAVAMRDKSKVVTFSLQKNQNSELAYTFSEETSFKTAAEPIALAVSAAALGPQQLFVATGYGHTVETLDLTSQKKKLVFDVAQEPRAVVALEDGTVMVSHANAGVLTKIRGKDIAVMRLDQGEVFSRQGFALTSIGSEAFAPDTFVLPDDTSQSMRGVASGYGGGMVCQQEGWHPGWVLDQKPVASARPSGSTQGASPPQALRAEGPKKKSTVTLAARVGDFAHFNEKRPTPGLESFDCVQVMSTSGALRRMNFTRSLVTQMGTACLLPRAAAASESKREVYVACLGSNRIEVVTLGKDKPDGEPENAPKFARGWAVPKGPIGLFTQGSSLLVWSQFGHSLTRINLDTNEVATVAIQRVTELDQAIALGRELFHAAGDARISQDVIPMAAAMALGGRPLTVDASRCCLPDALAKAPLVGAENTRACTNT